MRRGRWRRDVLEDGKRKEGENYTIVRLRAGNTKTGDVRRQRRSGMNNGKKMSLIVKYGTKINLCSANLLKGSTALLIWLQSDSINLI